MNDNRPPLFIGTYTPAGHCPDQDFIGLGHADGTVLVVFGPETDIASRYVAQMCDTHRVFADASLVLLPDFARDVLGSGHSAVLDELGRPWALTGSPGEGKSFMDAVALANHPVFLDAVREARSQPLILTGADTATGNAMSLPLGGHWTDGLESMLSPPPAG